MNPLIFTGQPGGQPEVPLIQSDTSAQRCR